MQVVVQRLAFAQEFRREDDLVAAQLLADTRGVADGDGRFDNDRRLRIDRHDRLDHGLDRAGVEAVGFGVVIGRCGDHDVVGVAESLFGIERRLEVQLFVLEEMFDFAIDDR